MAIDPEWLEILRCPKCKGAVSLRTDGSAFDCAACKLAYPVIDDIPNFIVEEALPLGDAKPTG